MCRATTSAPTSTSKTTRSARIRPERGGRILSIWWVAPTRSGGRSACGRDCRRAGVCAGASRRGDGRTGDSRFQSAVGPCSSTGRLWSISRWRVTWQPSRSHSGWSSSRAVRNRAGMLRPGCETRCTSVPSTSSTLRNESSIMRCATDTGIGPPPTISHTSPDSGATAEERAVVDAHDGRDRRCAGVVVGGSFRG